MSRHYDSRITKDGKVVPASDLHLADIEIRAGMEKGLPLAKPSQAGLTLELVLVAVAGTDGRPVAISFDWQPSQD